MPAPSTVAEPSPLLAYLFAAWPEVKKKQVRTWLKYKAVTVNGRVVSQFDHPLHAGDIVAIRTDRFAVPETKLVSGISIRHEDAAILVIEKPADLLTIATELEGEKTAYFQLTAYLREGNRYSRARVWIVHRLDRETSGLMVFAKTDQAKQVLQRQWDEAEKRYLAVVEGAPPKEKGVLVSDLDESDSFKVKSVRASSLTRHAVTHYRLLKKKAKYSLVELTLETGRRHQIRVQLADAGCPIVGDSKYAAKTNPAKRLALHACALKFLHPTSGESMSFESPLPGELARLV